MKHCSNQCTASKKGILSATSMGMSQTDTREAWQRGPVEGVPPLLQPVAHALTQAAEDAAAYTQNLPQHLLWKRPANLASVGFHLLHIRGVIDRLFTYARGEGLSREQLEALANEKESPASLQVSDLVQALNLQVEQAMVQLKNTSQATLADPRSIGREQIPTTVAGLFFHAAEHAQRHIGQLLVTARILESDNKE
jgi:uncharacterized damage-inducible protein DinB